MRTFLFLMLSLLVSCASAPPRKALQTAGSWTPPPGYQGNPASFDGQNAAVAYLFEPLFSHLPATDEWLPRLGQSFEEGDGSIVVTLRPDMFWHDGTPVTAKDVKATFLMLGCIGHPVRKYCNDIRVLDDRRIEFSLVHATPDVKSMLLDEPIIYPRTLFEEHHAFAEVYLKGTKSESELPSEQVERLDAARRSVFQYRPRQPNGTGPFRLVKVTAAEMVLERFERHPLADRLPTDELHIIQSNSNEVAWALLLSGELDWFAMACPIDLVEQIQKRQPGMRYATPVDRTEMGFVFNSRRLSDPALRRALIRIVDREAITEVAYPFSEASDDRGVGVVPSQRMRWLGGARLQDFEPRSTDHDEATALLKQAGYSRNEKGRWLRPDGSNLELSILCRAGFSDLILMSETAAGQWDAFGIPTQLRVVQPDIYPLKLTSGEFDLASTMGLIHGRFDSPVSALHRFFNPEADLYKAMGLPSEMKVDENLVQTDSLVESLSYSEDKEEISEGVGTLCRVLHDSACYLPIYEKRNILFHQESSLVSGWPAENSPYWSAVPGGAAKCFVNILLFGDLEGQFR